MSASAKRRERRASLTQAHNHKQAMIDANTSTLRDNMKFIEAALVIYDTEGPNRALGFVLGAPYVYDEEREVFTRTLARELQKHTHRVAFHFSLREAMQIKRLVVETHALQNTPTKQFAQIAN